MEDPAELIKDLEYSLDLLQKRQAKIAVEIKPLKEQLRAKEEQLLYEESRLRRSKGEETERRKSSVSTVRNGVTHLKEKFDTLSESDKLNRDSIARIILEIKELKKQLPAS